MKFRKRQLILASLVLALGTAVYLNWQFSDNKGLEVTNILESTDELGEARYVNNANVSEKSDKLDRIPIQSVSDNTKKYFAEAQINRQKAHDETEEKLKKLLSSENISKETKEEIKQNIESITKTSNQEANIENLIKSKGFSECLVCIQNDECNVIVNPGSVSESSAIIIRDIVTSQSEIKGNKIKIIEAK